MQGVFEFRNRGWMSAARGLCTALLASAALTITGSRAKAQDIVNFSTDHTQANVQIDIQNSQTYDFIINPGHTVIEVIGTFDIKRGQDTLQPISFDIYNAFNGTGHVSGTFTPNGTDVGSASHTPADLTQSYQPIVFDIQNLSLAPGDYSVALTSNDLTTGKGQYFFKSNGFNAGGSPAITIPGGPDTSTSGTPEPGSLALLVGMSLTGLGIVRKRRRS